jgi:hypothetical protein
MKSKSKLPILFLIFPFVIAAIVAVFLVMRSQSSESLEVFPVAMYKSNPANFYGNRYLLECQVDAQLAFKERVGRLVAVRPDFDRSRLAVFIPHDVPVNLHVQQRYKMAVYINNDGLIEAENLEKF